MLKSRTLAVLALAASTMAAQHAPSGLACKTCHTSQGTTQPFTSMAHALELPRSNPVLAAHVQLTFVKGQYSYRIETHQGESTYSVTNGTETISVPIKWSFGADSQTYVLEYKGRLYESLVSFYPGINGLDITIGDQSIEPATVLQAFGRELRPGEDKLCFGCHATGAVSNDELHLDVLRPGVSCDRCHVGAAVHFQDISNGKLSSVPPKLKKLTSEEISNFCGQCHRTWETVVRDRLRGVINVRFQPYRLANSKCFDGADPRISCIACHDPHQEVSHDDKTYDSRCLACHSGSEQAHTAMTKTCPVAKSGCVTCHMPKIDFPGGHRKFTDHDIRIVRANDSYPN